MSLKTSYDILRGTSGLARGSFNLSLCYADREDGESR